MRHSKSAPAPSRTQPDHVTLAVGSPLASNINPTIAKDRKVTAATIEMVFSEIREAKTLPPNTAIAVQQACPRIPPSITPHIFFDAPRAIVAIWDRSPHSAAKVRLKA